MFPLYVRTFVPADIFIQRGSFNYLIMSKKLIEGVVNAILLFLSVDGGKQFS